MALQAAAGAGVGPVAGAGAGPNAGAGAGVGVGPNAGAGPFAGAADPDDYNSEVDPFDPIIHKRLYGDDPVEAPAVPEYNSNLGYNKYFYPVSGETLMKEVGLNEIFRYGNNLVMVNNKGGSLKLTEINDGKIIDYVGGVFYSNKFSNTIDGLFALCSLDHALSDEQLTAAYRLIKDHRKDLNERNEKGETPLMTAIIHTRWTLAAALIKGGADPTLKTIDDKTALELLCKHKARGNNPKGHIKVLQLLLGGVYKVKPARGLFSCFGFGGHRTRRIKKRKQRKPTRRSTRK
jgi:hypothetical protein